MLCQRNYREKFVGLIVITILILSVISPLASFVSKGLIGNAKADNNSLKAPEDDWVITSDVYLNGTEENKEIVKDCNIIIGDGGHLHLNNVTLSLTTDRYHTWNVLVENGGILDMWGSTLRTQPRDGQLKPFVKTDVTAEDGSTIMMKHDSSFSFPGFVYIRDSELIMKESRFEALDDLPRYDYLWDGKTNDNSDDIDDNDDGPRLIVTDNSDVLLEDSEIRDYYENSNFPTRETNCQEMSWYPLSAGGNPISSLQAQDQDPFVINDGDSLDVQNWYLSNPMIPSEYIDEYPYINPFNRISSLYIEVVYRTTPGYGGGATLEYFSQEDTTWRDAVNIRDNVEWSAPQASDIWEIDLSDFERDGSRLEKNLLTRIDNNFGGSIEVDRLRLISAYDNDIHIRNSRFEVINSYIDVDYTESDTDPRIGSIYTEPTNDGTWMEDSKIGQGSMGHSVLRIVNSEFKSYGLTHSGDRDSYGDPLLVTDEQSNDDVWIYRWATVEVTNQDGDPLGKAQVEPIPENEISTLNQQVSDLNDLLENKRAWEYMNETASGYYDIDNGTYVTDQNGRVTMLLVSDRINHPMDWPNSRFVGNYRLNVTYRNKERNIWGNTSTQISLHPFPAMNETTNEELYEIQINVPSPPDLRVRDMYTYPAGPDILNRTQVNVSAEIENVGGSDVKDVSVRFYYNSSEDPAWDLIGETNLDVRGNTSEIVSTGEFNWDYPGVGKYNVSCVVDEEDVIGEVDDNNNIETKAVNIVSAPDLVPTHLTLSKTNIQEGETLEISAEIENQGGYTSDDVRVSFYVDWNTSSEELIDTVMVSDLMPGESRVITDVDPWQTSIESGRSNVDRNITVYVNHPVSDQNEVKMDNNMLTRGINVYSMADLYIPKENITFSPDGLIQVGQSVDITAEIVNSGGWSGYTNVTFFEGQPSDDNILAQNQIYLDAAVDGEVARTSTTFTWSSDSRGYHELYLMVDYEFKVTESDTTNNLVSYDMPIFSENYEYDMIVDGTDSPRVISDEYRANGFIVVREGGELIIGGESRSTQFEMKMDRDNQFGIIVEDNGRLVLDNTQLYSLENEFSIVVEDDAELVVREGSEVHDMVRLEIRGENSPVVEITDSTISGGVIVSGGEFYSTESQFTSQSMSLNPSYIEAENTTFSAPLDDFVDTEGKLVGVNAQSIEVKGTARIEVYRWLKVYALSNNSYPLRGADVRISSIYTDYESSGTTNEEGFVFLPALTNIILEDDDPFVGNYEIYVDYSEEDSDQYSVGPVMRAMPDYSSGGTQTTVELRFGEIRFPDIMVTSQDLSFDKGEVTAGEDLTITATVRNNGLGDAGDLQVSFFLRNMDEDVSIGGTVIDSLGSGESRTITHVWTADMTNHSMLEEVRTIGITIDTDMAPLDDPVMMNNQATRSILIKSAPQFDFPMGIELLLDGQDYTEVTVNELDTLTINTQIVNVGGTHVENATVEIMYGDVLIARKYAEMATDEKVNVTADWEVNVTGSQTISVLVKSSDEDPQYTNETSIDLEISPLQIQATGITLPKDPMPNKDVYVSGFLQNDEGKAVKDMRLNAYIVNQKGNRKSDVISATTNNDGYFTVTLNTPDEGGNYRVVIEPQYEGAGQIQTETFEVQSEGIPWWIIAAVVGAAAAGVIFVILYLRLYGPGEIVECGNCGATIPADSTKCPKCGVEFDVETVKCSECGNWIPADADICPECGAEFIITGEEVEEYTERMKNQYEKYKKKFKRKAEDELEVEELADEEFIEWWEDQPSYLTFDEWLEREEIKRKEGSIECPECGALNSVDDAVCYKCGSTLIGLGEEAEEAEEEEEETEEGIEELLEEEEEETEEFEEEAEQAEEEEDKVKKVKKRPVKRRIRKKVIKKPEEEEEETEEE